MNVCHDSLAESLRKRQFRLPQTILCFNSCCCRSRAIGREVIEPEIICVFQGCPVGLPNLWRMAGFKEQISTLEALWNISVTLDFTCWETPKCTAPTVENGEEIHQPVLVITRTDLWCCVLFQSTNLLYVMCVIRCGRVCSGVRLRQTRQMSEHRRFLHLYMHAPV